MREEGGLKEGFPFPFPVLMPDDFLSDGDSPRNPPRSEAYVFKRERRGCIVLISSKRQTI